MRNKSTRTGIKKWALVQLLGSLSRRIVRVLVRRDLLIADPVHPYLELRSGSSLNHLQAVSIHYRIAIGPQQIEDIDAPDTIFFPIPLITFGGSGVKHSQSHTLGRVT